MFEIVNEILFGKKDWEELSYEQQNCFTIFSLNQSLSQIPSYIEVVNIMNELHTHLTKKQVYEFYKNYFPKRRFYIKYVKKSAQEYTKELIMFLAKHIKDSKKNIEFSLQFFSKQEVEQYLIKCGLEDKEIKNMLKIFRK